jgi:hypothetical protein
MELLDLMSRWTTPPWHMCDRSIAHVQAWDCTPTPQVKQRHDDSKPWSWLTLSPSAGSLPGARAIDPSRTCTRQGPCKNLKSSSSHDGPRPWSWSTSSPKEGSLPGARTIAHDRTCIKAGTPPTTPGQAASGSRQGRGAAWVQILQDDTCPLRSRSIVDCRGSPLQS